MIFETKYFLNRSETKFISIGIDVLEWTPALCLSGSNDMGITINLDEFEIIMNNENQLKKFYEIGSMKPINVNDKFEISGQKINNVNILKFKKNDLCVYVGRITIENFFSLLPVINLRVKHINKLDTKDFYRDVLYSCIQLGGVAFDNIVDVLRGAETSYQNIDQGINIYCITELLHINPDIIKKDLYNLM